MHIHIDILNTLDCIPIMYLLYCVLMGQNCANCCAAAMLCCCTIHVCVVTVGPLCQINCCCNNACTVLCSYGRPLCAVPTMWTMPTVLLIIIIIIIGSSFHSWAAKRLGCVEHCPGCFKESSDSLTVPQC